MKKYDSYKDSGIEWIGEIPSHWEYSPVKHFAENVNGSTPSSSEESYWNGDINWVTTDDLGKLNQKYIIGTRRTITETGYKSCGTTIAPKGSVVISSRAPIGHLGILKIDACTNQGCKTLIPKNINSEFLYYYLGIGRHELEALGQGSTFKELPTSALKGFKILSPPISEQNSIANYLDLKTSQIDDLIAKKERLIHLLKEERTAIINQAVTKGLDTNVPMKDSGIEWLGEIPAHWKRARIKTLVKIKVCDGPHETPEWKEDGIPFISAEAIKGNQIDLNFKRGFISEEQHLEYCKKSRVLKGDILFCKSGSTTGKSALVEIDEEFGIWSPLAIIRVDEIKISNRFMFQSIQSSLFRNQVETSWTFGTQPNIGMGALENLWIAIPPLSEQFQIDSYLQKEIRKIEEIISKSQQEIELLKEYKTALISEVVTGKVDVRNEKIN
jgi:type I restriction enzyme S subunit